MGFMPITQMLEKAKNGKYAVGAFNFHNMEDSQGILMAAEEEKSPVIFMASQGAIQYAGIKYISGLIKSIAESTALPVVLHLDHGTDYNLIIQCIRNGFTSVMIDGSKLCFEENIKITKKVVEIAHAFGVCVEAELGRIGGKEDDIHVADKDATLTNPDTVAEFVERSGADALAIAIGTAHGFYKGKPELDFNRLAKIRSLVDVPLVLHGGTGIPDEDFRKAIELGINKINVGTELKNTYTSTLRNISYELADEIDPRKVLGPARLAIKEVVQKKIKIFGSSNKA
ncbi:MAG: fba [Thermoanaerobacter sp.]|jgi:fructose-bisphosphate aldolase class II|nr:fba [Thermoanaerobacter sp.]